MSEEMRAVVTVEEVVRTPISFQRRRRPGRTFGERLGVRFPGMAARFLRWLPNDPRSRLRRAALVYGTRIGFEATNCGDFDSLLARYHPEAETHHHPHSHELASEPILYGRQGVLRFFDQWLEAWEAVRYTPFELLDAGGNWFMVLSEIVGTGRESGIPVHQQFAQLFEMKEGWIFRVDAWMGPWEEALEAVGLSE
jgi:hypothetical protein